jgi:phosphoglucosamine mutase
MGKNQLFGTDGIRGNINSRHLQPENIVKLGRIIGLLAKNSTPHQASITIGRDTRASGVYLQHALIAGISSVGVDCYLTNILPTAAVAYSTKLNQSAFGLMISASHNPYHDNGIKLFDTSGFKIDESVEQLIENAYFEAHAQNHTASTPGRIIEQNQAHNDYIAMLKFVFGHNFSTSLSVVMDCANGAASSLAQSLFSQLGAKLKLIGCSPNGNNINHGFGSEAPGHLKAEVIACKADLGIAFDGDADRVIFVDEHGEIIEGDAILAIMAIHAKKTGRLYNNTMVATVMSSMALDSALAPFDIKVVRTNVGDKFIARKMASEGLCFGGENSGHLLFFPQTTTGDGIFSALEFLRILHESALPASKLAQIYKPSPRLLKNITVPEKIALNELPLTNAAIERANQYLESKGRVMFRYSGTENKARILVEAATLEECNKIAQQIAELFSLETERS